MNTCFISLSLSVPVYAVRSKKRLWPWKCMNTFNLYCLSLLARTDSTKSFFCRGEKMSPPAWMQEIK